MYSVEEAVLCVCTCVWVFEIIVGIDVVFLAHLFFHNAIVNPYLCFSWQNKYKKYLWIARTPCSHPGAFVSNPVTVVSMFARFLNLVFEWFRDYSRLFVSA